MGGGEGVYFRNLLWEEQVSKYFGWGEGRGKRADLEMKCVPRGLVQHLGYFEGINTSGLAS